jgi:hypothetical protein
VSSVRTEKAGHGTSLAEPYLLSRLTRTGLDDQGSSGQVALKEESISHQRHSSLVSLQKDATPEDRAASAEPSTSTAQPGKVPSQASVCAPETGRASRKQKRRTRGTGKACVTHGGNDAVAESRQRSCQGLEWVSRWANDDARGFVSSLLPILQGCKAQASLWARWAHHPSSHWELDDGGSF